VLGQAERVVKLGVFGPVLGSAVDAVDLATYDPLQIASAAAGSVTASERVAAIAAQQASVSVAGVLDTGSATLAAMAAGLGAS
ncbi:MAG: hypothetical protein ACOVRP_04695, partial [Gemmatimonas sp.]